MSRLSQTVIAGKRLRSCGTCTMPSSSRCRGDLVVTSLPRNVTVPERGRSSPLMHLSTVDFPAPLGPIRQVTVPSDTSRSTPLRMSPEPYPAMTLRSVSRVVIGSPAEVRVEDERVLLHLLGGAGEDLLPLVEHDDRIAEAHHEVH